MGKLDRPEESRQKDAAGIVVNLRARTGLKQVDSYEGEAAVPRGPVDGDVLALHDPHVGLKIIRRARRSPSPRRRGRPPQRRRGSR